jgi:hypothetical protein
MKRILTTDLNESFDYPLTIAVLGDTHISIDTKLIPDDFLGQIRQLKPSLILHTGDIAVPEVIETLNRIAPTYAVRGNRDILHWHQFPAIRNFYFNGITISLLHGHGTFLQYVRLKINNLTGRMNPKYISAQLPEAVSDSNFILFGHTHIPMIWFEGRQAFLNPGALFDRNAKDKFPYPSFAVIKIAEPGKIGVDIYCKTDYWHIYCSESIDRELFLRGALK